MERVDCEPVVSRTAMWQVSFWFSLLPFRKNTSEGRWGQKVLGMLMKAISGWDLWPDEIQVQVSEERFRRALRGTSAHLCWCAVILKKTAIQKPSVKI